MAGLNATAKDKKSRPARPHPYANEVSPPAESERDPRQVTLFWLGLATALAVSGVLLAQRFSPHVRSDGLATWEQWTNIPLLAGLVLLGFGFSRETWSKRLTLVGWVLFGWYWGLVAMDLLIKEGQDYVNFVFALVGVYFFVYLAYHQWLSLVRGVRNDAVHFVNVAAFITAGTYFLIAKVQTIRVALIEMVGHHTRFGLELFGQGDSKGLQFVIDKQDSWGPVTFFYPDRYCHAGRSDPVGDYCATLPADQQYISTVVPPPETWLEKLLFMNPSGESLQIVPVSIILACTAVQVIMLFVGLFAGTQAPLRKKVYASIGVGVVVYVLNLIRNVGIIWLYGQGHASFWMMHNAIGKGGSLIAMVGIAFALFRLFPEFFHSLVGVLDLPDRDGPIERTLKIGRRRPGSASPTDAA